MFAKPESEHVFVHKTDTLETCLRNYYHGYHHRSGNLINYSPAGPYKGEGTDFYAFVHEHLHRQDQAMQNSTSTSRIQYITPRDKIFEFDYANDVALEECNKKNIDVIFGQEMVKVAYNDIGQKVATFKDVSTGETYEHDFNHVITPVSLHHQEHGLTSERPESPTMLDSSMSTHIPSNTRDSRTFSHSVMPLLETPLELKTLPTLKTQLLRTTF